MAIDIAPEYGVQFVLLNDTATKQAVFNNTAHPAYVGVLSNISGLDSAEVRESGDVITEFDGGVQGPNYYGRRPIVLEGLVYGHATVAARQAKLARLMNATDAMREDVKLSWTPSGTSIPVYVTLRRQQPLRIEGGWNKTFQAAMVAADPRIYSWDLQSLSTTTTAPLTPTNEGNAEAWPVYTLMGPSSDEIIISNINSALDIVTSTTLAIDDVLVIDTLNRTVMKGDRTPGSRINYFPNTLSFPSGTAPWTNGGLSSVTVSTTASPPVAHPLSPSAVATTIRTASGAHRFRTSPYTVFPAAPGDVVTFGLDVLAQTALTAGAQDVNITFFNSAGTQLSSSGTTYAAGAVSTTQWNRLKHTSPAAPAGTAYVELDVALQIAANQRIYYTAFTLERNSVTTDGTFFDGSHPLSGHNAGWYGTVGNSTSSSYTSGYLPDSLVPAYSTINFTETRWSGLQPGSNSITAGWDSALPGAAFTIDWRHTWL